MYVNQSLLNAIKNNQQSNQQMRRYISYLKKLFGSKKKVGKQKESVQISKSSVLKAGDMRMPLVGLGTWQSNPNCLKKVILEAVKVGYRHFDTAYIYKNEDAIGVALKKAFECGTSREEFFITSKLPNFANQEDLVPKYLQRSLDRLGLCYLDLYLIHFPVGITGSPDSPEPDDNTCIPEVWQAMEDEVYKGKVKSIGVSNFNTRQIEQILTYARVPPSNVQVEMHLYCQQKDLLTFCKCHNITVTAYAPLGSPGLAAFLKDGSILSVAAPPIPLTNPVVTKLAEAKKKTPAQILLRHLLQHGVAVIPKSTDIMRIKENFEVFDFQLTVEEMGQLDALDKGNDGRMFHSNVWKGLESHLEFPFPAQNMKK